MKLYKNKQRPFLGGGYWHDRDYRQYQLGFIIDKEVDKFNGKIKVFVPIATFDLEKIRMFKDDIYTVHVYEDDRDSFQHLSGLNLEKASSAEAEALKKQIEEDINIRLNLASDLKKILNYIEEK